MSLVYIFLVEVFLGVLATLVFELVLKTNRSLRDRYYNRNNILWGFHIHHSMYGVLFIVIGLCLFLLNERPASMFCFAFGIGIIIQHTISDGRFVFIEKQKNL